MLFRSKLMLKSRILVVDAKVLILGFTFKENCPDVRNTKVIDICKALKEYSIDLTIYDPWAKPEEVMHEYGVTTFRELPEEAYDAVVLAVAHTDFKSLDIKSLCKEQAVVYDVKGFLPESDGRL